MKKPVSVAAINRATGETMNVTYTPGDVFSMRDAYQEADRWIKAFEEVKVAIAGAVDDHLGEEKQAEVGEFMFRRMSPVTKVYQFETVARFVDQDRLIVYRDAKGSPAVRINSGPLKSLLAELVAEDSLESGAMAEIESMADTKATKSYIKLERIIRNGN